MKRIVNVLVALTFMLWGFERARWRGALAGLAGYLFGAFMAGVLSEAWIWFRAFRSGPTAAVCEICGRGATPDVPVMLRADSIRRHEGCLSGR